MKILFVGYSNLFKNRIIPVLNQLAGIDEIHIAKYEFASWDEEYKNILGAKVILWDSYKEAFEKANVDLCYISSVNSDHYNSAKLSLQRGFHTIIDKPIVMNNDELNTLSFLRYQHRVLLAEAMVYTYHPAFAKINEILDYYHSHIRTINVMFSIPPMILNNFRYKEELGGGVLNDMGPYAASIGRYFYREKPDSVTCKIGEKMGELPISFDILLQYRNNRSVIGHFGFNSEYVNAMTILTDNTKIDVGRVFTIPDNIELEITVKHQNEIYAHKAVQGNAFYLFFKDVFNAIEVGDYTRFQHNMAIDSKTLEMFRHKI
jgi:dTDP-3,4-didehydro-2,6-dideoxy-alpha-D-glucose 3-reductase